MTIKIRRAQQDEDTPGRWYFQIYGPDSVDSTVRIAKVDETGQDPDAWLAANLVVAQEMVDAGAGGSAFTIKQEAKNFLAANPNAELLIDLGPDDLESTIDSRTAGQETLLFKTLSYAVRFLYASVRED